MRRAPSPKRGQGIRGSEPQGTAVMGDGMALPIAARRHPLVATLARNLRQRCGVSAATQMVVGVSGGADSTALLLGCAILRERRHRGAPGVGLTAVHVHHHLRESADDDAKFVQALCERLGVDLKVRHVEPGRLKGNVSASARRLRYEALHEVAVESGAGFVAVAHHGEDQLETMLIALCRGTAAAGLAGMPWSRALGDEVKLIRPLLDVRKDECESLCHAAGIEWCEDPSNRNVNRVRARLRRDVLPVLEELWPDAATRVTNAAEAVRESLAALARSVTATFGEASNRSWDRRRLASLRPSLIAAGLRAAALHDDPAIADDLGQEQLLAAALAIGDDQRRPRRFTWPGGIELRVSSRHVELVSPRREPGGVPQ